MPDFLRLTPVLLFVLGTMLPLGMAQPASAQVRATPPPGQITYVHCCKHPDGRALLMPRRCTGRMQSLPMARCKARVCCFNTRGSFTLRDASRCEAPVADRHCRKVCCRGATRTTMMSEGACFVSRGTVVDDRQCRAGGAPVLNIPAPDVPALRGPAGMRICCRYRTARGTWAFSHLPKNKCLSIGGTRAPEQSCRKP